MSKIMNVLIGQLFLFDLFFLKNYFSTYQELNDSISLTSSNKNGKSKFGGCLMVLLDCSY